MGIRVFAFVLVLSGCAQGHCRRQVDAPAGPVPVGGTDAPVDKPSVGDHVFVYKYDGSLQCGMGKAVAVDSMAKDLGGLQVFSSVKKTDGLMHIQVCGSGTGKANVYEIRAQDLKLAEKKGFKKWSFE